MQNMIERIKGDIKKYKVVVLACILYVVLYNGIFGAVCPLRMVTGLPCPGCGITRSMALIVQLEFLEAFKMHAFSYVLILLALAYVINYYILGRDNTWLKWLAKGALMAALIYYAYRMIVYFPDMEPMESHFDKSLWGYIRNFVKKYL